MSGLTGSRPEDYKDQFVNLVMSNQEIQLSHDDFDVRLPRVNKASKDPTPAEATSQNSDRDTQPAQQKKTTVTVIFKNDWIRRQIYMKRVKIGRGVFLSEDLTREESTLFYKCRMAKKDNIIKSTWTFNHKIFILTNEDIKVEVNSQEQIELIARRGSKVSVASTSNGSSTFLGFTPAEVAQASATARTWSRSLEEEIKMLTNSH